MTVTIYHNPRCGKSRETLKLLEDRGVTPEIIEYLTSPPSEMRLKEILKMLGKGPREILRKKEAAEAGIDADSMTDSQLIAAMVKNPIIIERPIVVAGKKAALGRPPENVLTLL